LHIAQVSSEVFAVAIAVSGGLMASFIVDLDPSDCEVDVDVGSPRRHQKRSRSRGSSSAVYEAREKETQPAQPAERRQAIRRREPTSASNSASSSLVNGNWMVANWYIGRKCCPREFAHRLAGAPFDVVVLVLAAGAGKSEIAEYFEDLLAKTADTAEVLAERRTLKISPLMYVSLHRAKLDKVVHIDFSSGNRDDASLQFSLGTVELFVRDRQQKMTSLCVGLVDLRTRQHDGSTSRRTAYERDVEEVVNLIVSGGVDILTGFFGHSQNFVQSIAVDAGATYTQPLYQGVRCAPLVIDRSRSSDVRPVPYRWEEEWYFLPTYFILCKSFTRVTLPDLHPPISDQMVMGTDIWSEMCDWSTCPTWQWTKYSWGDHLGNCKMKYFDESRWFSHCWQTVMWLGTSTPSKSSRQRQKSQIESKLQWPKGSVGIHMARRQTTSRSSDVRPVADQ
jgi:hypothetical protein